MSTIDPSSRFDSTAPASGPPPQDAPFGPVPQTAPLPTASTPYSAAAPVPASASLPARMRGPNLELMFTGLFALAAATFGLTRRVLGVSFDWARFSTVALIGVGLLAALVGLVGVIRRR